MNIYLNLRFSVPEMNRHHSNNSNNSNIPPKKDCRPIWVRKKEEARKRRQQQPVPFISGGRICQDGHFDENNAEAPTAEEFTLKGEVSDNDIQVLGPNPWNVQSSSVAIKRESPSMPTPQSGANWLNESEQGEMIMQMMQRMGYEQGKGLGKSQQGIVEPLKPSSNPGKLALGGHVNAKKKYRDPHPYAPKKVLDETFPIGKGENAEGRERPPAKRQQYEWNVMETLGRVGFSQKEAMEVWQAMGTLAKYDIMTKLIVTNRNMDQNSVMPKPKIREDSRSANPFISNLGMGLGLVKKRASKKVQEYLAVEKHCHHEMKEEEKE